MEDGIIETLQARRESACERFAAKTASNPRFANKWFPLNNAERSVRPGTRKKYLEKHHKTERSRNNPVQYLLRVLNSQAEQ